MFNAKQELAKLEKAIMETLVVPNSWLPEEMHDHKRGGRTLSRLNQICDKRDGLTEHAKKQIANASKSYLIEFRYLTPIVYTDVKDSGINLTVRYLTNPRRRRGTSQKIWETILDEFDKYDNIDFAYPTIRYYDNQKEGKSGTKPKD